jgi:hypothetical protein
MFVDASAVTMLCLGFALGFLLVISFIEKPILPLIAEPSHAHRHEADIRGVARFLRSFLAGSGDNALVAALLLALIASGYQTYVRTFDIISIFVSFGLVVLLALSVIRIAPAARFLRDTIPDETDIATVATNIFPVVRLHHNTFVGLVPIIIAQTVCLFY